MIIWELLIVMGLLGLGDCLDVNVHAGKRDMFTWKW